MIGRMPSLATASIKLLDGKHEIHSTPSVFKIRAMTCCVFIQCPPRSGCVTSHSSPVLVMLYFVQAVSIIATAHKKVNRSVIGQHRGASFHAWPNDAQAA